MVHVDLTVIAPFVINYAGSISVHCEHNTELGVLLILYSQLAREAAQAGDGHGGR